MHDGRENISPTDTATFKNFNFELCVLQLSIFLRGRPCVLYLKKCYEVHVQDKQLYCKYE